MRPLVVAILWILCAISLAAAQSEPDQLKEFLQNYVGAPVGETKTTRYSAAFVDLRDDGTKEVLVYLSLGGWCGTGGCTILVLAPEGTSYRVITKVPAARLPIRVLDTKSNGWHDIGFVARKSGTEPLYEAILSFDGNSYPGSVLEARESNGTVPGKTIMPTTTRDKPLYQ